MGRGSLAFDTSVTAPAGATSAQVTVPNSYSYSIFQGPTPYAFSVVANNRSGSSPASNVTAPILTPVDPSVTPPDAPTDLGQNLPDNGPVKLKVTRSIICAAN